jgi:hypothetical protein
MDPTHAPIVDPFHYPSLPPQDPQSSTQAPPSPPPLSPLTYPPPPPPFPLASPPSKAKGKGGGGGKWEEGGPEIPPCPPFPRPALPHLWVGPLKFGASVVFIAGPAQRLKKIVGAA